MSFSEWFEFVKDLELIVGRRAAFFFQNQQKEDSTKCETCDCDTSPSPILVTEDTTSKKLLHQNTKKTQHKQSQRHLFPSSTSPTAAEKEYRHRNNGAMLGMGQKSPRVRQVE